MEMDVAAPRLNAFKFLLTRLPKHETPMIIKDGS